MDHPSIMRSYFPFLENVGVSTYMLVCFIQQLLETQL